MNHDPKLQIFKLKLYSKEDGRPIQFRDIFRRKFLKEYSKLKPPIEQDSIFNIYFENFIKQIDAKGYYTKKEKGFTIAKEDTGGKVKSQIFKSSTESVITGILDGGKHNIKRTLGEISDTSKKTQIGTKHIVCDKFYFLLYTPIDNTEGILMIQ